MKTKNCRNCKFLRQYTTEGDSVFICEAEEIEEEDGFYMLTDVGNGEHPECLMWKIKDEN